MKFTELNLREELIRSLDGLGIDTPSEIQERAIPIISQGVDIIGKSKTGTGKTLAYCAPMLNNIDVKGGLQGLIICPTRELALQVDNEIVKYVKYMEGMSSTAIYGGEPFNFQLKRMKKGPQIIVCTPGRLIDHLKRRTIKLDNIKTLILDEADEIISIGFKEALEEILEYLPSTRQTLLFSATLPHKVQSIAKAYLTDPQYVEIESTTETVENIKEYYVECKEKDKEEIIKRFLLLNQGSQSMVFCNTKRKVDELTRYLRKFNITCEAIHGDINQSAREKVMKRFKSKSFDILIATDVAARGIDVNNLGFVFNYDLPQDSEYYVHRIGRTGRAGKDGISYSLITKSDRINWQKIRKITKGDIEKIEIPGVEDLKNTILQDYLTTISKRIEARSKKENPKSFIKELEEKGIDPLEALNVLIEEKIQKGTFTEISHVKDIFAGGGNKDRGGQRRRGSYDRRGSDRGKSGYRGDRSKGGSGQRRNDSGKKTFFKKKFGNDE